MLLSACTRIDPAAIVTTEEDRDSGESFDAKPGGFPSGSMPVIVIGTSSTVCAPSIAQDVFQFALCSCEDFTTRSPLITDSFDSRSGPYLAGGIEAPVGIDRHLDVSAEFRIGGSLVVGDLGGLQAESAGTIEVADELRCNGPLLSQTSVRVERDACIGGRVTAIDLFVGGTLRLPDNQPIEVSGTLEVGATERAPISVAPPCECDPSRIVDVPGFVARHATSHDDAAISLDPAAYVNLSAPARLELPDGRFYLDGVGGSGSLTISAVGRAALFIAGDVTLAGSLIVEATPSAEIDLFVTGAIRSRVTVGSPDRPAHVRVYLGAGGSFPLDVGSLAANVYAPRAEIVLSGAIEAFGSIFARRLIAPDALTIHYDVAIAAAGADCP